jgi:phosphopentomutase
MGFDVFDDIVNHSYDEETDKLKRLHKLINDNMEIILSNRLDKIFFTNKSRFDSNYGRLVNELESFYRTRFWKLMEKIKI